MAFLSKQHIAALAPWDGVTLSRARERTVVLLVLLTFCTWTLSRGFRFPVAYATAHWLFNYSHGFVKRGFVGTLVRKLFYFKSPNEILNLIQTLSIGTLFIWALGFVFATRFAGDQAQASPKRRLFWLPAIAFFTSSFVAQAAFYSGYFDRFNELITIVAIVAVCKRRFLLLPFLFMLALSIHELFIVYGFPVVWSLLVLKLGVLRRTGEISRGRVLFVLTLTTVSTLVFYLAILLSQATLDNDTLAAIERDVFSLGVYEQTNEWWVMFHLKNDLLANFRAQAPGVWVLRLLNKDIAAEVLPTALYMASFVIVILFKTAYARYGVLFIPAFFTPMILHFVAWDTHRFSSFVTSHCFFALIGVVSVLKPRFDVGRPVVVVACLLFIAVLGYNLTSDFSLFGYYIMGKPIFIERQYPTREAFVNKPRLFFNSDFEDGTLENWERKGTILAHPKKGYNPFYPIGKHGYGTYDITQDVFTVGGDHPTGSLLSIPFTISHDTIIFSIAGGGYTRQTYVALEVDGKEVYRDIGQNAPQFIPRSWDVSAFRGRTARIRIVDRAKGPWGHIDADEFCYWP